MMTQDNRISIQQAKESLLKDKINLKDNVSDQKVLVECYRALSVVENIMKIVKGCKYPELDFDRIEDVIDEAYPYWYAEE